MHFGSDICFNFGHRHPIMPLNRDVPLVYIDAIPQFPYESNGKGMLNNSLTVQRLDTNIASIYGLFHFASHFPFLATGCANFTFKLKWYDITSSTNSEAKTLDLHVHRVRLGYNLLPSKTEN
jgi:hypothetical protein